jgi:predicted CoA-binding protein
MSILIDQTKRVLVQGITGREGMARTKLMREYGTNVVAGVTPGKGGQQVEGVNVFDTIQEAWENAGPIDVSVLFIPAPIVKAAALEAIAAGVKLLVIVPDRVPIWDVLAISKAAKEAGASFVGPNTLGVLSPDKAVLATIWPRRALVPPPLSTWVAMLSSACLIPRSSSSSNRIPIPGPSLCSARLAAARRSAWRISSSLERSPSQSSPTSAARRPRAEHASVMRERLSREAAAPTRAKSTGCVQWAPPW